MNLLDIVQERALTELPTDPATCPYCGSTDVKVVSRSSTLLGFTGPVDPNHQWHESVCNGCKKLYTRELKELNVWYTAERGYREVSRVLKGIPTCFEDYQYTCAKCSGPVLRAHRDRAGNPTKVLSSRQVNGVVVRDYTTHYNCTQCGHGGEVDK
jgi:DNA-directed RNA polymerase subunit RPC12/RpoP